MDIQEMTIGETIELIQSTETATFKLEGLGETTISTIKLKPLVEAYEKQIPKPPVEKVHPKYPALGKMYYCVCGVLFTGWGRPEAETKYCGNCGQRLKGESLC